MDRQRKTWNARSPLLLSVGALVMLAALIGAWAARANIAGAVIGKGTIKVSNTMTAVQHPIGGVVAEIFAFNGDQVDAGDVVVRLEDAQLRSDLKVVEGSLFETLANIARLEAEIDGRTDIVLHPLLEEAVSDRAEVRKLVERTQRQLTAQFEAFTTEARLLDEQVAQAESQILGIAAQVAAKREEKGYIDDEMNRLMDLADRGLLKQAELFNLQKNLTAVNGEIGRLEASIAELRGKISEIELKRHTIIPKEQKLAVAELSKLRPDRAKFLEQRASILSNLSRLDIRAPISGRIHDSKVLGLRSVVVAASPLMMIIPDAAPAMVLVKVDSSDIDQVFLGQNAQLKFTAFNGRHIPIILGDVIQLSADAFVDPITKKAHYEVIVSLKPGEIEKLGERELIPGMPVEAFFSTESRTPMNYMMRPVMTYLDRAFRD
ncbi:HlyD family type I secretion periplasmic adaptor subunit [Halovulum sp. GXIMD14794]